MTAESVSNEPWRRRLLVAMIVVELIAIGIVFGIPGNGGQETTTALERLDSSTGGVALSIESGLAGALAYARDWEKDAYLFAAAMQVEWPRELPAASSSEIPATGWIIYTFGSDTGKTLSILVDRRTGTVFHRHEMTWEGSPARRILSTTYPISPLTALFATETTLGHQYRLACPQHRNLARVAFVPASDERGEHWLVSYEDSRALGQPAFIVRVDAMEGTVNRTEVDANVPSSCDS